MRRMYKVTKKTYHYRCPRCKRVLHRRRRAFTFRSYCERSGGVVRVWRIYLPFDKHPVG